MFGVSIFNYGCTAQVELPLNMQLSTDLTMYSRRGYIADSMNTNELVWNARLTKRMVKGKLLLLLATSDVEVKVVHLRRILSSYLTYSPARTVPEME
ncbi:MAG: hypothetical protein ACI37N_06190 [Prevotella sp.]